MNIITNKKKKGFTLLELMIAMAIGLIVILGTGAIMVNARRNQIIQTQQQDMQRQGQDLTNLLRRYIRNLGSNMCVRFDENIQGISNKTVPTNKTSSGIIFKDKNLTIDKYSYAIQNFGLADIYTGSLPKTLTVKSRKVNNIFGGSYQGSAYRFFTRSALLTSEFNNNVLTGAMTPYSQAFAIDCSNNINEYYAASAYSPGPANTFISTFPKKNVVTSESGNYVLPTQEINVFEDIMLILRGNELLLGRGTELDTIQNTVVSNIFVPIAQNISRFELYYAERLTDSFVRNPATNWILADGNSPYEGTPVAIRIVFTITPPATIENNSRIQDQTFEVVAAVRTIPVTTN